MSRRPLFGVAAAFTLGIVLSGVLGIPAAVGLSALSVVCLSAAVCRAYGIALLCVAAAVGFLRYDSFTRLSPYDVSSFLGTRAAGVVGTVASDVDLREDRALFPLKVRAVEVRGRQVPALGRLMVVYYRPAGIPEWEPPAYGDAILIRSRLSRPSGPSNPGAFSWRDYLARQRIHAVVYVRDPGAVIHLGTGRPNPIARLALLAKSRLARTVASALPHDEASVVTGMALGTYTTLPDRLLFNFTRTGTMHLLAASGFNCAVLIAVFGFALARTGRLSRRTVNLVLIGILIFYMLMVGTKPSIVRATIMASLVLAGAVLNRPGDSLNLLFGAAVIILAINPADMFDIGFQLSFGAVLALVTVLPMINEFARRWNIDPWARATKRGRLTRTFARVAGDAWQGLAATAAATLGTLPLTAHYFNQFSTVSVVVNALVAASVLPIFVVGLLLPAFSGVPIVGDALSVTGMGITRVALSAINWFGELPYSCLSTPSPGAAGIAGYYAILAAGIQYANWRTASKKRTGSS